MRPLILALALLAAAPASQAAEEEPDRVVLESGSRITGTVRELERGALSFSITGARTAEIDWGAVELLRSSQVMDVELASGERFSGPISSPAPGRLEIATAAGPKVVDMKDVVRIHPIAATFRERTTGAVDVGFDFLTAGDEIDWTLNGEAQNRTKKYLTELQLNSLIRRRDDTTEQRRNRLDLRARRFLDERWFALGLFTAEEDRELDLDLRVVLGAAGGRTLLQSNVTAVAVYGGIDVAHEEYRGVADGDGEVFEVLGAVEWDWFEFARDTELSLQATTYVKPDDGRVRFELQSSLRREIVRNYFWSLNVYESYNSDPPADLEKSDLGVAITIGRSF